MRSEKASDFWGAYHFCPAGFSCEITIIDAGFTDNADKFETEITVPEKKKGTMEGSFR